MTPYFAVYDSNVGSTPTGEDAEHPSHGAEG